MFEVYVLKEGVKLPLEGNYYVVTEKGIFLHKETGLIEALVKVEGIPFLEKLEPKASMDLPKIPRDITIKSLLFFRQIQKKHKTEAILLLHYSKKNGFKVHCPSQEASSARVDYNSSERFKDYQLVGTIHSHNNFQAFHSSGDEDDEKYFDGIHLVFGNLNEPYPSIESSIVVNNNRFPQDPEFLMEGIKKVDKDLLAEIHQKKSLGKKFLAKLLNLPDEEIPYRIVFSKGEDFRNFPVPRNWAKKVTVYNWIEKQKRRLKNGKNKSDRNRGRGLPPIRGPGQIS